MTVCKFNKNRDVSLISLTRPLDLGSDVPVTVEEEVAIKTHQQYGSTIKASDNRPQPQ